MRFAHKLHKAVTEAGLEISVEQAEKLEAFWKWLSEENRVHNLTAIVDEEEAVTKHFVDSLTALSVGQWPLAGSLIDVGSGPGFPGIPLAVVKPRWRVSLLESVGKKTQFLEKAVAQLGLSAAVLKMRAEEAGRQPLFRENFDVAVARALAPLPVACEWCMPLVKVGGRFIAMRGAQGWDDLEEAKGAIRVLGGEVEESKQLELPGVGWRVLASIIKTGSSPGRFPRPGGAARRRPLSGRSKGEDERRL